MTPSRKTWILSAVAAALVTIAFAAEPNNDKEPRVIDPGPPPSDAIVLFDGKDTSKWKSEKGGEVQWKLVDGAWEINGTGSIVTKEEFGDCQLHVEWATPREVKG